MSGPERIGEGDTRTLRPRPQELVLPGFALLVVDGPNQGKRVEAASRELAIGTAPGNDLVLDDPTVSRHHAAIVGMPDGFLIRDLGSTNGTMLGGYRVEAAYLKPGAPIAIGMSTLRFELLDEEIREALSDDERFGRLLGKSPAMRRLFAILPKMASSDATVLLEGETGTGKGLVADAIHQSSPRREGPFVVVDCGSIAPSLIESELLGHEKGAFTGAHAARAGAFEAARGGTVFLDEIGELPLDMQPKLLRALEDRVVKRVGGNDPVKLDVRVIAATHRDLRHGVNRGTFRADLYYRLNVLRVRIPPLRERPEDVALLAQHFHEQFAPATEATAPQHLLDALARQDFPGNVRELRAAVERAVLLGDAALADDDDQAAPGGPAEVELDPALSFRAAKERATARWERAYLRALVKRSGGNLSQAARDARMDRSHLRELLRRHGIGVTGE